MGFWRKYPSPHHVKDTSVEQLEEYLRKLSNYALSTNKAEQILALIEADDDTCRDFQDKRDRVIESLVRNIRFCKQELTKLEGEIRGLMKALGFQLNTLTGVDLVTASELVAEIGDIHRFPTANKLARFAGVALLETR